MLINSTKKFIFVGVYCISIHTCANVLSNITYLFGHFLFELTIIIGMNIWLTLLCILYKYQHNLMSISILSNKHLLVHFIPLKTNLAVSFSFICYRDNKVMLNTHMPIIYTTFLQLCIL